MKTDADRESADQFQQLAERIDAAIDLIASLKQENRELRDRLSRLAKTQQEVARRLDDVLDKVEDLT